MGEGERLDDYSAGTVGDSWYIANKDKLREILGITELEKKLDGHIAKIYHLNTTQIMEKIEKLEKRMCPNPLKLTDEFNKLKKELSELKEEIWKRAYARMVDINFKDIKEVLRELIKVIIDGETDDMVDVLISLERKLGGEKTVEVNNPMSSVSGMKTKTDSKPPRCSECKKSLLESFNEHFPDANDGAWDIIKSAIENMNPSEQDDKIEVRLGGGSYTETPYKEKEPTEAVIMNGKEGWDVYVNVLKADLEWLFAWCVTMRLTDDIKFGALREKYNKRLNNGL